MSTAQKRGANYDNEVAIDVDEKTDELVTVHPSRGSGNTKTPQLDVLVRTPKVDHFIELKKYSCSRGDRRTAFDTDDLEQIEQCANVYTRVYIGVRFSNCQLVFFEVKETDDVGQYIVDHMPSAFDANYTDSGNVSLRKPVDTDVWPSYSSGKDDVDVILEDIGLQ